MARVWTPRTLPNAAIVVAALVVFAFLIRGQGRTEVNGGLGREGPAYVAMVVDHDVAKGGATTRQVPAFPLFALAPYLVTHDVRQSFALLNLAALALLVLAACVILDTARASAATKSVAAFAMVVQAMPSAMTAFDPIQPDLFGVALLTAALAGCEVGARARIRGVPLGVLHLVAALASPLGIVAPLYGLVRSWRLHERGVWTLGIFVPAVLAWFRISLWARGIPGLIELVTPSHMRSDLALWGDPAFVVFALYALATALGGLTLLLWLRPRAMIDAIGERPELLVLIAFAGPAVVTSGTEFPRALALFIPFWLFGLGAWSSRERAIGWSLVIAAAVTVMTQRPGTTIDGTRYFVDWFPFVVHSGRAGFEYPELRAEWTPRFVGLAAAAASLLILTRVTMLTALLEKTSQRARSWAGAISATAARISERARARTAPATSGPLKHEIPLDAPSPRWTAAAYVTAVAMGTTIAVCLLGIPIQLSDSFANLLGVMHVSLSDLIASQLQGSPYFRPLLTSSIKVVYTLADGHLYGTFRGLHAIEVIVLLVMVVRVLRVSTVADASVVPLGLAVVLSMHTFAGTIREAFPINAYFTILLCGIGMVLVSQARYRLVNDIAAIALLTFAALTAETGLLLWVIGLVGYLVGYRGISRSGVLALTATMALYFLIRFAVVGGGVPGLEERSAGFGFSVYDPADLIRQFGANPLPFYIYNLVCAVSTVLFGEPRGGLWLFTRGVVQGGLQPWQVVNVLACSATTILIARYVVRRFSYWKRCEFNDEDRIVLLFLAILPANAAFAAAYEKDVILSPAGVFFGLAAAVALRELIRNPIRDRWPVHAFTTALLAAIAVGWSIKLLGVHYSLRQTAVSVRNEWAYYDDWASQQPSELRASVDPALKQQLYDDAIERVPQPPVVSFRWADAFFDRTQ
jgi:hypothetical protein